MRVNAFSTVSGEINVRIRVDGVSHPGENFDRGDLIGTDDGGTWSRGTPAVEHALGRESGEDGNEGDAGGGGNMLSGRIVANIKTAVGDKVGEARETTFPICSARARLPHGALHAFGLFASGAAVHDEGGFGRKQGEEFGFE